MASGGFRSDLEEEFPSMAADGVMALSDGNVSLTDGTVTSARGMAPLDDDIVSQTDGMAASVKPRSRLYFDTDVELFDPEEDQAAKPEEEENPYMSLRNCVLDMFKADMADIFQTMNIHEFTENLKENRDQYRPRKSSMLMSSIYRRQKSQEYVVDEETVNVLVVRNLDTHKIAFLKASDKYQTNLVNLLKTFRAEVQWAEVKEDRVQLTENTVDQRTHSEEDVQLWRDEVDAVVTDFFKTIMVRKVAMMPNAWTKMKDRKVLSKFDDLDKDLLVLIPSDGLPGVVIAGDIPMVTKVAEEVLEIVRSAEEQERKEANIHRASLHGMELWKLQYLLAIDISSKFSAKYKDLKIEIDRNMLTVNLSGPDLNITKAKFEIEHILNRVECKVVENVTSYCLQAYTMDEFQKYIHGILRDSNIEATFLVLSDELWVYSVPNVLEGATAIIRESVKMRYIKTDGLSLEVWERVLHSISQTTGDPFYVDYLGEEHKAALIAVPTVEPFVMEKLKEATKESALQTQRVQLEKDIFLVLKRTCLMELEEIKSKYKVDISFDHAYCMVAIKGPSGQVASALTEVQNVSDRVFQHNLDLSAKGASKFCQSLKGDLAIKEAEEEFKCVLEVELGCEGLEDQKLEAHVNVIKGEISHQLVDVIVNPVPDKHSPGEGRPVYSVLVEAGSLVEGHLDRHFSGGLQPGEVAVTSGGNLRCKSIFHCCVPRWSSDSSRIEDYQELIKQCLDKADVSNYSSIAFPALGCEKGGYPPVTAATAFLDAILSYEETTNSGIKLVNIVVDAKDGETYDVFNNERNNRILGTKHFKEYAERDDVTTTAAGIRIVVHYDELAKTKADALVNTTNVDLDLSRGAVSASLLKAAGKPLQRECHTKYPDGIKPGQLAVTSGWKLPCKNIYHCNLPRWVGNPEAKETLERIIDTCLEQASGEGYETLAFPALGTGVLKYPSEEVAAVFKDRVAVFSHNNPLSCLREIIIVLYHKDVLTCKVFSGVFDDDPGLKEECKETEVKSEEFQVGTVNVSVKKGTLLEENMDAIVVPTDNKISLSDEYGIALIKTCGYDLMQESKCVNIKKSGAVLVSAKRLPAAKIMFISTEYFKNNMDEIVQKVFRKASKNKIHSLALPHINAAIDADGTLFAKALVTAFTEQKKILKGIKNINIVMTSQPPIASCISALKRRFRDPSKRRSFFIKETDTRNRTSVYLSKSELMSVSDRPHLRMLGIDEDSLRRCEEKMKSVISENTADKMITNKSLSFLKQKEIDEVMALCKELDVDVKMDLGGGRLQLQGIKTDVNTAHRRIDDIINNAVMVEDQRAKAMEVQKRVQWYFMKSDTKCEFKTMSNYFIENAYREGTESLPLHLPPHKVVLNFKAMALRLSPTQLLPLIREDRGDSDT